MKNVIFLTISIVVIWTNLWSQPDSIVYDPEIDSLIAQVSGNFINQHIQNLADADGHYTRVSYTQGNVWAAQYIKQTFESFPGLTSVAFDTFFAVNAPSPYDTIPLVNIVATLQGMGNPSQNYVIGGHFDATANLDPAYNWDTDWPIAISPGSDDNASGIAATLEIARILSDHMNNFNNDFTIKFIAFGAEERHPAYNNENHLGSNHYVHDAYINGDNILGAYILDMIGFNTTGNHYFNIVSNNPSTELGSRMLEVNTVYQIGIYSNSEPFPEATYSDHEQFWQYAYKAILLIENAPPWNNNPPWYMANPYYHKQTDTPNHVNLGQVEKVTKLTLGTIAHLSTNITSIKSDLISRKIPRTFSLKQNYPNPFNAMTSIEFDVQKAEQVTLEIYNLMGQKVGSLINERMNPGTYKAVFDGSGLASGVYLYKLKAGEFTSIKKMFLIK